ncbi:thiamine diphosphokinase [Paenibacillus doosanensis]|uniref:Thiamine diphosphokinase n=1 Tax=Paenibacillus konkukensis TaxID=2020716 RepID=A0ABY4RNT7_9BACL|nr:MULTISPECIES: thiamine diphosphokinase [Paenibacillus]MCS7459063.1 thiamine diphosphokinase [Paenibacillus doosanensis]UQZ84117.1 Thiamine pyrophosphokinase [Paenibacillus konkukensis]
MTRVVIFSGGSLGPWALRLIQPGDLLVGADKGALFLLRHGRRPDVALGDFDSVNAEEKAYIAENSGRFISCDPVMKDLTDTEMAFNWALEKQPDEIVLCGALGTRWDHALANVHLLRKGLEAGLRCRIIDAYNEIAVMDQHLPLTLQRSRFSHVSLLPLSLDVEGIELQGFQYPLHNAKLTIGQSLGISNCLAEPEGTIAITAGMLLVIQSSDQAAE